MKKTMYKWMVIDKYDEIVSYGIENESIEMPLDYLHRAIDSCSDKNMSEIQEYLDEYHLELKLRFYYKEIEVDFADCVEAHEK